MNLRTAQRGVGDELTQSHCLKAEFTPNKVLTGKSRVPFVEDQVNDFQYGVESLREVASARQFQAYVGFANLSLGTNKPLRDRGLIGEQGACDLSNAKSANNLQAEGHAEIRRERRVATHEEHP